MRLFHLKTTVRHFVAAGTVDKNKPVCYTSVLNAEDKKGPHITQSCIYSKCEMSLYEGVKQ